MPADASTSQMDWIRQTVVTWVELLAAGNEVQALELIPSVPHQRWTPHLLRHVISNYGSVEPSGIDGNHHVTAPASAIGTEDYDVTPLSGGRAVVHYQLPLDGEFSDLTAVFEVIQDGRDVRLRLDDVHVL